MRYSNGMAIKLLQVTKFYSPYRGGIETMVEALSEGLAQSGKDVTVLCADHASGNSQIQGSPVRVLRLRRWGTWFSQPLSPGYFSNIAELSRNADLVHLHLPNPLAEAATLAALPSRIPLVISYHSDVIRQRVLLPLYRPILRRIL